MAAVGIAKLLRLAQRNREQVCCDLADGSTVSDTPHSVCIKTAWLITSALPSEDVFVELTTILQVRSTPTTAPAVTAPA